MKKLLISVVLIALFGVPIWASDADDHAPIGVMGEHTHKAGEFMGSYRFMRMEMKDNRIYDTDQSLSDIMPNYMVAPLSMTMDMHMFGAMYAPNNDTTLMLMLPYISQSMNHEFTKGPNAGTQFSRNAAGIGDISITALSNLKKNKNELWILNTGISVPVGSIEEKGGTNSRLPYAMQLGSGTYDFILGTTYTRYINDLSIGAQFLSKLRTGLNKNGYRLGNTYHLSSWVAKNWTEWISTSVRMTGKVWDNLDGVDSAVMPNGPGSTVMVPTAEQTQGGRSLSLGIGANLIGHDGFLKDHRLAVEFELPVHEYFLGTHLKTQWVLTVGWQKVI